MKLWIFKFLLLVSFLLLILVSEGCILNSVFRPQLEHNCFLEKVGKKYIQKEHGKDSIFVELSKARLHSSAHISERDVFHCEGNEEIHCYISVISCFIEVNNSFWNNLLVKGRLPQNDNEIAICEELSKRRCLKIGDVLSMKTALSFRKVIISGITLNPYGISMFNRDDNFYVFSRENINYISRVRGSWFSFSDYKTNDLGMEDIGLLLNEFKKYQSFWMFSIFILNLFLYVVLLFGVQNLFTLRQYYNGLISAGIEQRIVKKKIIIFELIYFFSVFILAFFIMKLNLFIIINEVACFIAITVSFLYLRRKTYGSY